VPINTAKFPSNWELSTQRATNVLHFFSGQSVPESRMHVLGFADTVPLAANDTDENRASNRRVNLIILRKYAMASISPLDNQAGTGH
jgi:chemotaxis protein MotB